MLPDETEGGWLHYERESETLKVAHVAMPFDFFSLILKV